MLRTRRAVGSAAALAVAGLVITACGSSSSGSSSNGNNPGTGSSTPPSSQTGFQKLSSNNTGTPQTGGTLNVAGIGDVDYMDPNITYYTVGYMAAREYSRQLYSYEPTVAGATTAAPDLATAAPVVTDGGKTLTITIKQGAQWNTNPPRQVTAADEVRGVEITCNPYEPFGGTPDFADLIQGYNSFCKGFGNAPKTVAGIKAYLSSHQLSGVTVGSTPETVVFHLTQPATYFQNELALPALGPRPQEMLNYLPASAAEAQHTISDGPYEIQSYQPTKSITFVRNPAWKADTDTLRKAYVDKIVVTEGEEQTAVEQQVATNRVDLAWDTAPTPQQANALIRQNAPNLNVQSEISSNPYLVWNTQSPNNNKAMQKVAVRQALEEGINRDNLIQDAGGPKLAPPLTHVLPPQIDGAKADTNWPYAYDATKAKADLAAAGAAGMTIKFLYRPSSDTSRTMFQDVQAQLTKIGVKVVGVSASPADFYVKYLEKPTAARSGQWDVSLAGWGPDWYGNAALSFFKPLFDGRVLPPLSSNFGLFSDPAVNTLIDTAAKATTVDAANAAWGQADDKVISDAAIFPIDDPNEALLHSDRAHNDIYIPAIQNFDFTNVWLSS